MKRSLLLSVVLSLMLVQSAAASHAPGGPTRDFAVGGGRTFSDIFNIAGHSGPLGENAYGHMNARNRPGFTTPTFDLDGEVLCLRVANNRATLGGRLTKAVINGVQTSFQGFIFFVEDNGNQQGAPDRISNQFVFTSPVTNCPPPGGTPFDLTQGNLVVHDG